MPTVQENDYKVSLDIFEGPLDLLLYLIRKDELDIYDIPIETITSQYMEYLSAMRIMNLDIAGEFIVMASTLMLIKSRMLLPVEERVEQEDEEEDDPRWDLVRQLVEYKKFKDSAYHLHEIELRREGVFGRSGEGVNIPPSSDVVLSDVGLFDLISAFNEALHRVEKENLREIFAEHFTVAEKIDEVRELLIKDARVSISALFQKMNSRNEIVCTFLAVLELIRTGLIRLEQERVFGDIWIENQEQDTPS